MPLDGGQDNRIVVSISSDIGAAMAERWLARGCNVAGTFRTRSARLTDLAQQGAHLVPCDMGDAESVHDAGVQLATARREWDVLTLCAGTMEPIGPFAEVDFDEWARSIEVNFTSQLRMLHALLPYRRTDSHLGPCVLLMAGGGTNGAPPRYSAYTASKIALMKMCELLGAELPDVRIAIVGPGWVRTKIHTETLSAAERAGDNYTRTLDRLNTGQFTRMESVLDCCDWIVESPRSVVGGRNFSVVYDPWGSPELESALRADPDLYKLRRSGNARFGDSLPLPLASAS